MTPTAEQSAILDAVRNTKDNLLITARAGGAKTTTLCLIAGEVKGSCLCMAFNKDIQLELQQRLPPGATARTLNAIGYKALWQFFRSRMKIESDKMFNIIRKLAEELEGLEAKEVYDNLPEISQIIRKARQAGYVPDGIPGTRPLCDFTTFAESIEEFIPPLWQELFDAAIKHSYTQMLAGVIDFDDQIYWPAVIPSITFESADNILVDEAQDLSVLNQEILRRMARRSRVIAVGDPAQAIYGFRGAMNDSMDRLRDLFSMKDFSLTICFRSDQAIVKEARFRAPEMQWRNGAAEGTVRKLEVWTPDLPQQGDVVICRNNGPLFKLALIMLRRGIYAELVSGDVVKGMVKKMQKFGPKTMSPAEALSALEQWAEVAQTKTKNHASILDQKECMALFIEETDNLGDAIALCERIMQQPGRIKLMTGHKAKGLEFDNVFFLDQHLISKKEQDPNIRYVIITRARHTLTYVESSKLQGELTCQDLSTGSNTATSSTSEV